MNFQSLAQLPDWFGSLIAFLLGLAVGSFVNVVIHRVPRHTSIITPGSRCTNCHTPLKPRDNIPIVSYILLRGRCRYCGAAISWRYPIVELIMGMLFWLVWLKDGLSWSLVFDWAFVAANVALAGIDLGHRILPDVITYPGFVLAVGVRGLVPRRTLLPWWPLSEPVTMAIGAGLIAGSSLIMLGIEWLDFRIVRKEPLDEEDASLSEEDQDEQRLPRVTIGLGLALAAIFLFNAIVASPSPRPITFQVRSIVGAVVGAGVGGGILWIMRLLYHVFRKIEGVGFGDIKMMMMLGAYLGASLGFLTIFGGSILGSVIGLAMIIKHRDRRMKIPYGVFLAIGAVLSLLVGEQVVEWYGSFYED